MRKLSMAALAAVTLAGCASAPPGPEVSTYTYESKAHSGTVHVTEKWYTSDAIKCAPTWRDEQVYTPSGLLPMGYDHFDVSFAIQAGNQVPDRFKLVVPQNLGVKVLAKDYQTTKDYMLGTETNGIVQQGSHFTYPEGYYLRVSTPSVEGAEFKSCIGIDHMYVLKADLDASTNPPIYLDRLVVPFAMSLEGQPVQVSFGSAVQHTVEIKVQPVQ